MKVVPDTNVLVRAVMDDDRRQAAAAARLLRDSELIAITLPCLCEFVWVLRSVYRVSGATILSALDTLLNAHNVEVNQQAVAAGMAVMKAGGDFADGVIAFEGTWLGGDTFATFDKQAAMLLATQGHSVHLMK